MNEETDPNLEQKKRVSRYLYLSTVPSRATAQASQLPSRPINNCDGRRKKSSLGSHVTRGYSIRGSREQRRWENHSASGRLRGVAGLGEPQLASELRQMIDDPRGANRLEMRVERVNGADMEEFEE